uniref:Reverse transcriptase Ty1/copia-type domain-containing protein n=1 Tax=Rhizophora mucronata TaxID=61149 RepID=A0A2P2PKI3_RHIMU
MKYDTNRNIKCYKARLVTQRYAQMYDINYEEPFILVVKLNIIRVLILHQMDVKNAFLNGCLEEEVYMKMSPEFETQETIS